MLKSEHLHSHEILMATYKLVFVLVFVSQITFNIGICYAREDRY